MGFLTKLEVHGLVHLSLLLLSSYTVFGDSIFSYSFISHAHPPHYMPGHPPVAAPIPHKGHHHHHHPHPHPPAIAPTPPPVKPPTPLPSTPPVKPPTPPPSTPPVKPPTPPPTKPPTHPPVKPPSHPPSSPPVKPPSPPPTPSHPPVKPRSLRKLVAVQGVVYCKSCKYTGINTLLGAKPLGGATVRLLCKNTKYHLIEDATTDKNGYFLIKPKKLTTSGSHKCKVLLLSSPSAKCKVPTNLRGGRSGAILVPALKSYAPKSLFALFTVGPFAFEPSKKFCKH